MARPAFPDGTPCLSGWHALLSGWYALPFQIMNKKEPSMSDIDGSFYLLN
jgi:hypothetical protein